MTNDPAVLASETLGLFQASRRHAARLGKAVRDRSWQELMRDGSLLGWTRWRLRHCDEVGPFVRALGPVHVRNRGEIFLGDDVRLESTVTPIALITHAGGRIVVGRGTYMNFGVCIEARAEIRIGAGCHLAQFVHISDNDQHDVEDHLLRPPSRPVVLEEGVWLGVRTVVLRGVTIGAGTTIGAGSVVTRSLPSRCVAVGSPARIIRRF
jgi:acetyltransferase-like isoleucine patch superfamily enzyme